VNCFPTEQLKIYQTIDANKVDMAFPHYWQGFAIAANWFYFKLTNSMLSNVRRCYQMSKDSKFRLAKCNCLVLLNRLSPAGKRISLRKNGRPYPVLTLMMLAIWMFLGD
jgi:hypothetical protein